MVLFAGVYAGDGIDTDGAPGTVTDNADINIALTKYPQLTKGLVIELRSFGGSNEIRIVVEPNTVRAPNGALINHSADQYLANFIFDIPGGTLTFTTTNGTEFLALAGRHSSGSPVASLTLAAGTFDMPRGSSFRLSNGSSITISGTARFLKDAPQTESVLNLTYRGSGSFTAGSEASYSSFGSGVLTVNKDSGTTISFPYPMSFSGNNDAIRIQSGNAIFNGSLTLGTGGAASSGSRTADLVVSTSGSVVFNAPVTLTVANSAVHDSSISTIDNAGSGNVTFQHAVTWYAFSASTDAAFPASETTAIVWNAGTGALTFASGIVLSHVAASGAAPSNVEVSIQNNGQGTLRLGAPLQVIPVARNSSSGLQPFSAAAINAGGGVLEISGTLGSRLVNARSGSSTGTINITSPTTLGWVGVTTGVLLNARDGIINLGPNTLTLSGSVSHTVSGSYVTSTSGGIVVNASGVVSIDGGSLPRLTIEQPIGGSTRFSNAAGATSLVVNSGDCALQSSLSVMEGVGLNGGSLTLEDRAGILLLAGSFRQTGGLMNLGGSTGGTLKVLGDFTRTAGSFLAGSSSSVMLAGTSPQIIDPGITLQLGALTVDNSAGIVRCMQPLWVSSSLTIGSGSRLALGNSTILLNGQSAVFTNNGSFEATGLGIVLGGTNSLPGGASLSGSEIHAGTGSKFSSFTIDIGTGNSCAVKADENASWTGMLSLLSGSLDIASSINFAPSGLDSRMTIDVVRSKMITRSKGSFNNGNVHFVLRLIGALQNDYTMPLELMTDLLNVDTLQIDVSSGTNDNLPMGLLRYFQFPGGVFVFGGSLLVGPTAAVRLEGNGRGGDSIELTGSTAHRVRGILATADPEDVIVIGGDKATLAGGVAPGDAALVGNVAIRSASSCKITAIRGFLGSLTMLSGSSVSLSMGSTTAQQVIAGSLILNGNVLSLEGNIEVKNGVAFNSGVLNFGSSNLQITTAGDFVQAPSAGGYSSTGGYLVMNRPNARLRIGSTEQLGLPNLQVLASTYLDTLGRVTKNLAIGTKESDGIATLILGRAGNDLVFTGSTITLLSNGTGKRDAIVSDGRTDGTPGGRLFVIGTSVTLILNGDYSIEELVYNPPAIDGTLSLLSADLRPHVLTISDILTHAGGQIGLGFNHLALTGTGSKPGSRAYNRSDGTIGASSGEMRFVGRAPQQFSCGVGSSIPNLRIWNSLGVAKSPNSDPIIVTRTLDLSDGAFTFDPGTLIVENGATVIRRRSTASISTSLSFRSAVNVFYLLDAGNGNLRTGPELPSDPNTLTMLTISNPNPSPDSSSVVLSADAAVKARIVLDAGKLDVGTAVLTLAAGGTIEVNGGRIQAAPESPGKLVVSSYKVNYTRSGVVNAASQELQSGPNISVTRFSIYGSDPKDPTVVRLYANRAVEKLLMDAPNGGIEFGAPGSFVARNLTIRDSMTILSGSFTNSSGTNAVINLAGAAKQVVTLPDTGLTLSGGASAIHLQLNNAAGFLLRGGNLKLNTGAIIFFVNGVLDAGDESVVLSRTVTSQGFDRLGIGSNVSHIAGRVRQSITGGAGSPDVYPNGRYEFPTGTATRYRPLIVTFTSADPARNPGILEVAHVNSSPSGALGLPLDGGLGVRVGSYASFHWSLKASPGSLSGGQKFDLETSSEAPGFRFSNAADARMIFRSDGTPETSAWNLLGTGIGYGTNSVNLTSRGDTVLTVRVQGASQELNGTTLLTVGVPLDRRPYLNFRVPSSISQVPFNVPTAFRVSIRDPDNKPLTVLWKVNGVTMKAGSDTSFTYTFQGSTLTQSVRAVFSNGDGLADSTEWSFVVVDVADEDFELPSRFSLDQNFPNPFNPATAISYQLPAKSLVTLKIYDLLGKEVAVLVDGIRSHGAYTVHWDATGLPSGTYLCRFIASELSGGEISSHVETRRMLLTK